MLFVGSAFSKNTKNHIILHKNLVGNLFATKFAARAVKIAHQVAPSAPSDALWHETVAKMASQREGFSGEFGSIFDPWLNFWLQNPSMVPWRASGCQN